MSTLTHDEAIACQLCWKPQALRTAMVCIVETGLWSSAEFWPDEISFKEVPADAKNAIGNSFKTLLRAGLIIKTGAYRNSRVEGQKGRIIWAYHLPNANLARTFLVRNGATAKQGQQELAL